MKNDKAKVTVPVRIYKSTRAKAKQLAAKRGVTISQLIDDAVKKI